MGTFESRNSGIEYGLRDAGVNRLRSVDSFNSINGRKSFNEEESIFRSKERVIFLEVKQQLISLVLNRSALQAKETFGSKKRARALINDTIQKLEGDLL